MHKKNSPLLWRQSKEHCRLAGSMENVIGVIESFTIVYNAPKEFKNQVPYILALISLNNGKKVTSQIVDSKKISIGMKVEPCLRRVYSNDEDIIHYGTKFRVV